MDGTLLVTVVGMALIGVNPAPAVLALAALSAGATGRALAIFASATTTSTAAWVVIATNAARSAADPPVPGVSRVVIGVAALLQATLALTAGWYAVRRPSRIEQPAAGRPAPLWFLPTTAIRATLVGVVPSVLTFLDPTFLAASASALHATPTNLLVSALLFAIITNSPLLVFTTLLLATGPAPARQLFRRLSSALSRTSWLVRPAAGTAAALLSLDLALWLRGLVPAPLLAAFAR